MPDIKVYKTRDLVLSVSSSYDPAKLHLDQWANFLDVLCGDRQYQKDAIRTAIIYLASGRYKNIQDLVTENWAQNPELSDRYKTIDDYLNNLPLPNKLSGVIDLATGTGKSYVMYGIAQIALGLGVVDRVLVLCPSLTIEKGLQEKFKLLAGDDRIKDAIPSKSLLKNPSIVDANQTIKKGDIAVENIHAVYERTGSSIVDSFSQGGDRVLVLSDEVHHAYNSSTDQDLKKWLSFLSNPEYGFKYTLGVTGTAYVNDNYFNDVLFRYSLRQAVDDKMVKSVEYIAKDESITKEDKFQKIYDNHVEFVQKYRLVKPLTILICKDISSARALTQDFIDFLAEREGIDREAAEKKVLIVTSHKDHKRNIAQLQYVDDKDNEVQWIVSVSMLTEGWDVKNVFQIVPWQDRAFNSKLLIAQVLGRGLRIPSEYQNPQPRVRVFNHDSWSRNIKSLVDEILEIEVRVVSSIVLEADRAKYHFTLHTINYSKQEIESESTSETTEFDYSKGYAKLEAQVEQIESDSEYEDLYGTTRTKSTILQKEVLTIDEVVDKIIDTFKTRNLEASVRFPEGTYKKESPPPPEVIRTYIENSMKRVGITSGVLTHENASKIYSSFHTLFRPRSRQVVLKQEVSEPALVDTRTIEKESTAIGAFRHGNTMFFADDYKEASDNLTAEIITDLIEQNDNLSRSQRYALEQVNSFKFKTPLSIVVTSKVPEEKFVDLLVSGRLGEGLESWVKSRNVGFYSIEFSWRKGEHQVQGHFNPDFIIKSGNNYVVVEVKADGDDSEENKAKFKWAKKHFDDLNTQLAKSGKDEKYFFHFLSPNSYSEFAEYFAEGKLFNNKFVSRLDNLLEI